MNVRIAMPAALVAAVTVTSVATAGSSAAKQRVQLDMKIAPKKSFLLTPLQAGALKSDSGTHDCIDELDGGTTLRDGQETFRLECRAWVFTGKRGKLVLRSKYAWVEAGGAYNIATGTWRVVSGTGQYAGAAGSGRTADVGGPSGRIARYQGYITVP
jgi:hypothetical protein